MNKELGFMSEATQQSIIHLILHQLIKYIYIYIHTYMHIYKYIKIHHPSAVLSQ
jgi:hypothetical protein